MRWMKWRNSVSATTTASEYNWHTIFWCSIVNLNWCSSHDNSCSRYYDYDRSYYYHSDRRNGGRHSNRRKRDRRDGDTDDTGDTHDTGKSGDSQDWVSSHHPPSIKAMISQLRLGKSCKRRIVWRIRSVEDTSSACSHLFSTRHSSRLILTFRIHVGCSIIPTIWCLICMISEMERRPHQVKRVWMDPAW